MDVANFQFYANQLGWPLFPCSNRTKAPLTPHGFKDATCDLRQLDSWHAKYPNCALGTPTSAERGVIDIDPRNGGAESLARLIAEHGPLPHTPTARTGGGGWHYWHTFPPGTRSGLVAPGIDRKAEGGYVIVPPSRIDIQEHEGRAYAWELRPWEMPLAEAPAWCVGTTLKANAETNAEADDPWVVREASADLLTHPGSGHGERREIFCGLVGVHLARGDSEASVYAMAEAWAMRCTPTFDGLPNPDDHWEKHLAGLMAKDQAKAMRMTTPHAPLPYTVGVSIAEDRSDTLTVGREGANSGPEPQPSAEALSPAQTNAEAVGPAQSSAEAQTEFAPSLPPSAECGEANGLSAVWPSLFPEAKRGLLGEMLRAIEPETEADPAGVLLGWLTCFGSIVGRGAWVQVGPLQHHPALYVGVVGRTSDAKGDGWAASLWPFREVEKEWAKTCIANGVGSGEGLIERVADTHMGKDGIAQGATDKRCLLRLSELSRCFKVGRRENATLSEYMREAWDGEPIHLPNRKKNGNALSASDYAVSFLGDITPGVLRKLLEGGTEAFDGWANRFLWAAVERSRFLPSGGSMDGLKPYLEPLAEALAFAKQAGELRRDAEADALWAEVYPSLATSGDDVPHTDRARPYALRLAILYALADCSAVIRAEHLRAALALWDYCRASARLLFGGSGQGPKGQPDDLWLVLLNAIARSPGISRTGLREEVGHKVPAQEIEEALAYLERSGYAYRRMAQPKGGGRPAECWYPVLGPVGDGEGVLDDNPSLPLSEPASPSALPEAGREGGNSPSQVADSAGSELGREENGPALPTSNFLPPSPEPEAESREADGERATGVVRLPAQAHYAHEPEGGIGLNAQAPTVSRGFPLPKERWHELYQPPAERPPEPMPECQPGESEEDDFLRRLE